MTADHRQRLCDEALADLDGITRWEEEAFPHAIAKRKKLGWSSWWVRYRVDTTLVRAIQRYGLFGSLPTPTIGST